ncbi:hypothetical protein N619_28585 [Ectopseudomonas oleovorans]|nr:hypothetical protein N619_28585 [Pseudomonas oleovorans]
MRILKTSNEWASIDQSARDIVSKYQESFPVAVGAIASEFGIKVLKSTMPGSYSGEIREENGVVTIKVNRHDVKERQRFTIAHEIAHFLLHRDRLANGIVDDVLYRSRLSDTLEKEANRLAADIIMPVSLIKKFLEENRDLKQDDKQRKLAEEAQVSLVAVKIRIGK